MKEKFYQESKHKKAGKLVAGCWYPAEEKKVEAQKEKRGRKPKLETRQKKALDIARKIVKLDEETKELIKEFDGLWFK